MINANISKLYIVISCVCEKRDLNNWWLFLWQEIQSQCATLLAAGYETTSTALAYATYEIALNSDVQKKLQDEIANNLEENVSIANAKHSYIWIWNNGIKFINN